MSESGTQVGDDRAVGWHRPWLGLPIAVALGAALIAGFAGLPRESARLPAIALHALAIALPRWGTTEAVNEIVYGSRGFDTFGETFILVAAIVSVVTLSRSKEGRLEYVGESDAAQKEQAAADPGGRAGDERAKQAEKAEEHGTEQLPDPDALPIGSRAPERTAAMSVVVRTAARPAAVILPVAGVYIAAWGYTPGGGFPAGVVLTGVAILLYAALGRRAVRTVVKPTLLEPIEMVGGLGIVAVGVVGLVRHRSMFANWVQLAEPQTILAGGNQQLYSLLELVEVAVSLTIAVFALLGMGHDWAPDDDSEDESEE